MTCGEFVDFLSDYVEGTLDLQVRRAFDTHLAECPDCADYLQSYDKTVSLLKSFAQDPDAAVPDEVPESLVGAILASRDRNR
jgi:anti-sigma factor RsiW